MKKKRKTKTKLPNKRFFTLLEILICLALLSSIAVLVVVRARPMLDKYRFDSGVERLLRELNFTKKLALSTRNDISLELTKKDGKLTLIRKTDAKLNLSRTFDLPISLSPISHLSLDGEERDQIELYFMGTGWLYRGGILHFSYRDRHHSWIDLKNSYSFSSVSKPPEKGDSFR